MREMKIIRQRVRGDELGARFTRAWNGLDMDGLAPWCQHQAVRESPSGQGVGITRFLSDHDAHRLREIYSMDEFDLEPLKEFLEPGADA